MKLVATLTALAALTIVSLTSVQAFACDKGDSEMGPNCLHVETTEVSYGTAMETDVLTQTTAYRMVDDEKVVVWEGYGVVKVSTAKMLSTVMYNRGKKYTDNYTWNGTSYVKKGR